MSSTSSSQATNANNGTNNPHQDANTASSNSDGNFDCNICLDIAKDAVVSMCGHLFCWPCLHQWLETKPNRPTCPVCKAAISRDKVIPLYGRGSSKTDPRDKRLPPRPQGQRSEPETNYNATFPGFGDGGFHMSFGIGAFPFGFFASTFNFGDGRPAPAPHSPEFAEDQFLSKVFLWVALLFIIWLLIA